MVRFSIYDVRFLIKWEVSFHYATIKSDTLQQTSFQHFCHDMRLESQLKPLTGEIYHCNTPNVTKYSRLNVSVLEFWFGGQFVFSDIIVFKSISQMLQVTRKIKLQGK